LRSIEIKQTIYAKDFGVLPDDGKCDAAALQNALDALAKLENAKLVIEKGIYDIAGAPKNGKRALALENARRVQVDGGGAKFLISSPFLGFLTLSNCKECIVENMTVDYDPLPHSTGKIVSVNKEALEVVCEVLPKHPRFDAEHLKTSETGFFMEAEVAGRPKRGMANGYAKSDIVYEGKSANGLDLFRVKFKSVPEISLLNAGDYYTHTCKRSAAAFGGENCQNSTLRDIDILASPAGAFTFGRCSAMNFINCRNTIAEGRRKSTNADGFHHPNNRVGPWIEDCRIEGIADDCANIYLVPLFVAEQLGARALRVCPKGSQLDKLPDADEFFKGDEIAFFTPETNTVFATARITDFDAARGVIRFDKDVADIVAGLDKRKCTTVYNVGNSRGVVIKNSSFKNSKRFGLYIKAEDVLIENNCFEGLSSSAITMNNEPGWPEGLWAKRVIIRGNTFKDCGFEEHYEFGWPGGMIASLAPGARSKTPYYLNSDIVIENNTFYAWRGVGVYMRDTQNAVVKNNKFFAPAAPSGLKQRPNAALVHAEKSQNIVVENNENATGLPEFVSGRLPK